MRYDLLEFEKRVELGYLRKSEWNDLILYGYTDRCTFDRAWDKYTTIARGLILNKNTGEVVAKTFSKFFNVGETEETFLSNLPNLPYTVSQKVDGSLGIIFHYKDEWHVATRGSFYSGQAVKAKELLKKYDLSNINPACTLLVEIVYPENKIIVDYKNTNELVLLASFVRTTGEELDPDTLESFGYLTGMSLANQYNHTIEEMIALQDKLSKDEEGFVVRFENGLRVKIKGTEYLRIAKLMASLSPIALWETMKKGKVDTFYLQQLPEELRKDYKPVVLELEKQYDNILHEAQSDYWNLPFLVTATPIAETRKKLGLYLKDNDIKHKSAMFHFLLDKQDDLEKYIMKQIRPDGNNLRTET